MSTNDKSIAERAYELWVARGSPHGSSEHDWHEAERLAGQSPVAPANTDPVEEALAETFPASDPPASHTPDLPPSNSEEKWTAARGKRSSRSSS